MPRNRSPRAALLQIKEAARYALASATEQTPLELIATLARIERLALEALYPVGRTATPAGKDSGKTS